MKVRLIGLRGYNYTKDGEQKQGVLLRLTSLTPKEKNDGNGNFEYGLRCQNDFYLPKAYYDMLGELIERRGQPIEIITEKQLGDQYETVSAINFLEQK